MKKISYLLFTIIFCVSSCQKDQQKLFKPRPSSDTGITFNNRIIETDSANILTEEYIFNGGGIAVGDFNNDGKPDLYFTGNQVSNALYLNEGRFKFKDVTVEAGVGAKDRWSTGVTVVDVNGDNKLDIYVCAAMSNEKSQRANLLYVNQGLDKNGVPIFKEMASVYGIAETGNSMAASFFDYDKDGLLDLYVLNNQQTHELPTNYRKKVDDGTAISNDRLYHNNGDGTFTDVTMKAGIIYEGFGLGIAVSDINYDGWPDIYISNDYLTNDLLYINNGDGTFTNEIENFIRHQSKFSMGSDISDFNNDGLLDIITLDMLGETNYRMKTTIGHNDYISYIFNDRWNYGYQYSRNMLQQGNGPGEPFSEIGLLAGISRTDWSWSPLFVDVDNDGYRDLLITNGFPRDITDKDFGDFSISVGPFVSPRKILDSIPTVKIPNYAYKNNGNGTFTDKGESWGLNIPSFSNGAIFADLDNDGDMDYVVNNIDDEAFVFENTLNKAMDSLRYLNLNLVGPKHNPMGIGAKLVVRYGDNKMQYYEHELTRGYMSSVAQTTHFGLGTNALINSVEVLWPDGKFQRLTDVKSNRTITIKHDDAHMEASSMLSFPLTPKKEKPLFTEVSKKYSIDYTHEERDVIDYNVQRIMPHKLSQNGPCLAKGDINGDGTEDFIVGSSSTYSPVLFLQKKDGTFSETPMFTEKEDKIYEEESMVLFDLDNDGDLDLYMVSGGNEFEAGSDEYSDRLFTNDGKGNFTLAKDKMPLVKSSGSVVKAQDFDNDGYMDLFVGGRTPIAQYPYPDKSFLLRNNNGKLEDVTEKYVPGLRKAGMVTDALWVDVDKDGLNDLILVGELMPITIFKNNKTGFKKLETTGLEDDLGWWESINAADFDNDGDMDFVVGNMGSNNFYQPSKKRPVTLIAKDFDENGSVDPIMFAYFKDRDGVYKSYPVKFWGDLFGQSPLFRQKFNFYKDYAKATQETLLSKSELEGATKLIGNDDKSSYVENLGNGKFKISPLPLNAQLAPVNSLETLDFNKDDNKDVLLIGNDYGNETFIGRYDAFNGLLLKGDGHGGFKAIPSVKSGFFVPGDAKEIVSIKSTLGGELYLVTQNKGKLLVYQMLPGK